MSSRSCWTIRPNFGPIVGILLPGEKNKNWSQPLCQARLPRLPQPNTRRWFTWRFQQDEKKEAFFWGWFFIIKTSLYLLA